METLILGGYTRKDNKGLSTVTLDVENGKLGEVKLVAELDSPTYAEAIGDFVFSIMKEGNWAGVGLFEKQGETYRQVTSTLTEDVNPPCYVSFDRKRQFVFISYYHQGFFEVAQLTDEGLELVDSVQHEGSSIHANQQSSHVHYSQMDRESEYLLVCDLGTDKVHTYRLNTDNQVEEVSCYQTDAGFGPRHLVEHPTLPMVYIVGELSNQIDCCRYEDGVLTHLNTVNLLPEDFNGESSAAAIRLSEDGQFLYASNRGHDSIVVYRVSEQGELSAVEWVKTEGQQPRDFNFNKTEDYVIVGHQENGMLSLFKRDKETGQLALCDKTIAPECVCVAVVK